MDYLVGHRLRTTGTAVVMLLIYCATVATAQKKADKAIIKQLKADIGYLASDELEGRLTGSEGERKAGDYIINSYTQNGIKPYKDNYRYPFKFVHGREVGPTTRINIGGNYLRNGKDAFPLPFSADKTVSGEVLPDVMEQGSIWMIPLYQSQEEADDPHFDWEKYAYEKTKEGVKLGATGVIFYDGYGAKYPPAFNSRSENERLDIVSVLITYEAYHTLVQGLGAQQGRSTVIVEITAAVAKTENEGTNIAAYIDNHAPITVVLGAHYDHLGYGEDGNSLYRGKEKQIHNGADDNASGTAALLQLASWIKKGKLKHYNYLFINFSGEELGLFGSKAFVKDQTGIDSTHIAYMVNMDMVGRLNDSTHSLTVGGIGTSPIWGKYITKNNPDFRIGYDSSGVGPSDHTSFYNAGIPVLFFFTGSHSDYHKPTDDADKINYPGEALVMHYIYDVVKKMDKEPKPVFTVTKQPVMGKTRFKVTLGIIPDYAYQEENGLRVDGVSEGRPAALAGIKAGDIISQMGEHKIKGIQSYMEALGAFKPGDKTDVKILRGKDEKTVQVEFK